MRRLILASAFLLSFCKSWAEPRTYVGSAVCQKCHAAQFASQAQTGHAHALVRATAGSRGEWAFGAGEKATTWVSQVDHDTYAEHGVSYFAATKSNGLTPGHTDSSDVRYHTFDPEATTLRCFRCHSTGPLSVSSSGAIQPSEPGVHCESCHGPGSEHVASSGLADTIINPKRLTPTALNNLCGACHRKETEGDWTDKWKTRHQPTYLRQSACFRNSGTLSCLTCHDSHLPLSRVAKEYDARCAGCHKSASHRTSFAGRTCVSCHMPQVTINAQLSFTNHWIGIYSPGPYLVPARTMAQRAAPLTGDADVAAPADAADLRPLFEQALADNEKSAHAAFNLGAFLSKNGHAAEAEAPLRQALSIDRANGVDTAADSEILAQVLSTLGRNDEAVPLFQIAAESSSEASASLAMLDPAHAEEHYRRALSIEQKTSPRNPKRLSTLLNDLAMALEEKHDYPGAEALFRQALNLDRAELGGANPATAATLSNLGSLLETRAQHQEAERMEREAIEIFERTLGPWSAELATSCANLADILSTKGDVTQALVLYRRSIAIDESVYGRDNPEVAGDLVNLGTLLKQAGREVEARSTLGRALAIYEKTTGANSPQAKQIRDSLR